MHKWIRNTHLLIGLFSFLFLLMYGMSAVQMAHNRWFSNKPAVTESEIALTAGVSDARVVARELMDRHGLRGELAQVRKAEGGLSFRIVRPGTVYEVAYSPETGNAKVRTNVANIMGMLNRIHHLAGLGHDFGLINAWGVCVGLVSAALILLGATGIYLWFKIHSERVIGVVLLVINLSICVTLLVLIRAA